MAPEMALGQTVDGRADLYALGCVAYYLLTGHLVFEGATRSQTIVKHLSESRRRRRSGPSWPIPPELERLVLACLAKQSGRSPAQRRGPRPGARGGSGGAVDQGGGPQVVERQSSVVAAALTMVAVLLLSCVPPSVASRTRVPAPTGPIDREVASFVRLMNKHRVSRGLPALAWDRGAAVVAQAHSRDMYDRHYFSHTSPEGSSMRERLAERHITYSRAGENIAWGQGTGSAVLTAWLRSRGHRKNIETGSFTHHGVAKVGTYWTHVFIRPRRTSASR